MGKVRFSCGKLRFVVKYEDLIDLIRSELTGGLVL